MEQILLNLDKAAAALKLGRQLYEQFKEAGQDFSEDDQAALKERLAALQLEYDTLHDATQKKLRG